MKKHTIILISVLWIVLSTVLTLQYKSGKVQFSDFKVYYGATKTFTGQQIKSDEFDSYPKNTQEVYFQAFGLGSGLYKYQPTSLLILAPISLFSWNTLSIILPWILTFLSLVIITLFVNFVKDHWFHHLNLNQTVLLGLSIFSIHQHLFRELSLGNLNFILLGLLYCILTSKKASFRGIILCVLITIKLHFLVLLPVYFIFKKYKDLGYFLLSNFILNVILIASNGFEKTLLLYEKWFNVVKEHNHLKGSFVSVNTAYYWPQTFMESIIEPKNFLKFFYVFLFLSGLFFIYIFHIRLKKISFHFSLILIFSIIPSITYTDTNHFLFSLPIIIVLLNLILEKKGYWNLLFIPIVFFSTNFYDIFGKNISNMINSYGVIGISNILFVLLIIYSIIHKNYNVRLNETV